MEENEERNVQRTTLILHICWTLRSMTGDVRLKAIAGC